MIPESRLFRFLGWNSQGDLGGWTFYTSQRKELVWFIKSPPLEPPSFLQTTMRNRFRAIGYAWRSLTPAQRQAWATAAANAGTRLTGYNLFVYWLTTRDDATIETIERQANVSLIPLEIESP